ncbi:MAG TPA: Rrf2 family transcriptional regulator, partial [Flavisolibacter sp.]|nr:Rrf2 family transcriptional regulator [Flavisolibacter sp.]
MKITAQEEYGLRILIRIARCNDQQGMSIPQLSEAEGLTSHYVAKLTRILRLGGFINSTPGYKGGYV